MAITGKVSGTVYYGPSTTQYAGIMNVTLRDATILWREGAVYYVNLTSPAIRGYIPTSQVTGMSGGTPGTFTPSLQPRYIGDESIKAYCGPGSNYTAAVSPVFPQGVSYINGKKEGSYAFVEYTRPGNSVKFRAWVDASKLVTSQLYPGKYTTGNTINSAGDKWAVTNDWASNTVRPGHLGIDVRRQNASGNFIPENKDVYAIAAGTVVASSDTSGGTNANGKCMIVRHISPKGNEYFSTYCHLERRYYEVGATVIAGQAIGLMGQTGNATALHVHIHITNKNLGLGAYGYNRNSAGDDTPFSINSIYKDPISPQNARYYNPTAYFLQGVTMIDNNYK